ncbi:hypothetical protein TSUD_155860 [Trifolium subterraneum]|uniref:Response regulatory domain-containing protein n=1 Tax=Trifolium subterraneum TaxID=3900 RepID=A0A2Z6MWK7_TRISU|nr:hypothetical protein TSUD_155860 [Trifolium subterraneum]
MNLFTANISSSFPAGLRVLAVDHDTCVLYTIHHICNRLRYQDQDTYTFVQQMTSLLKIPVIMMSLDNQPRFVMNSISNEACSYWTKPLYANLFKNMWQNVVRKSFSQSDPDELEEAKGLKKRGRDDVDVV